MEDVRNCEQCGAEFEPRREHARFCSAACSVTWNRGHGRGWAVRDSPLIWSVSALGDTAQSSAPLQIVDLLRDETADMAWAVEHVVEGDTGPVVLDAPPPAAPPLDAPTALAYRLASTLPPNWFPLLPVPAAGAGTALVVGTVEDQPRAAAGRLVKRLSAPGFGLPEHELGRAGLRLQRVASRTRAPDGTARLWLGRRRTIGAGEASSGLRYDAAEDVSSYYGSTRRPWLGVRGPRRDG